MDIRGTEETLALLLFPFLLAAGGINAAQVRFCGGRLSVGRTRDKASAQAGEQVSMGPRDIPALNY